MINCPCSNLSLANGQLNTALRRCGGDFIVGASWEEPKDSACDFTAVARRLCRISEVINPLLYTLIVYASKQCGISLYEANNY